MHSTLTDATYLVVALSLKESLLFSIDITVHLGVELPVDRQLGNVEMGLY